MDTQEYLAIIRKHRTLPQTARFIKISEKTVLNIMNGKKIRPGTKRLVREAYEKLNDPQRIRV